MYIKAVSKRLFITEMTHKGINDETVENFKDTIFISVNEPEFPEGEPYFKKEHKNVLTLHFHDTDDSFSKEIINMQGDYAISQLFTEEMAQKVINLLQYAKDTNVKSVIVHCTAGISRSGAIASFARDFFNAPPYEEFKRENWRIVPNSLVTAKLINTWKK